MESVERHAGLTRALETIERERYQAYSDLVRNLHWLKAALVGLYAVLNPDLTLALLALYMALYTIAMHHISVGGLSARTRMQVEGWIDLLWSTLVIGFSGGVHSPFVALYYVVVFIGTPYTQRRHIYSKAAGATVALLLVVVLSGLLDGPLTAASLSAVVWPLAWLWTIAYFAAEVAGLGSAIHRSLLFQAHTDDLTELPNMRCFTRVADWRDRTGEPYAIVMVDADYLKELNDTFGHQAGSRLIRSVAEALRNASRSSDDVCSRLGGDEFIVRLAGTDAAGAQAFCRRVRVWLAEHPLSLGGEQRVPSISAGIAVAPEHGTSLSEVTARADQALYWSKEGGRGCDSVWSREGRLTKPESAGRPAAEPQPVAMHSL